MTRQLFSLGVATTLLFIACFVSVNKVKGIPLQDDRISTIVDDIKSRILNELGHGLLFPSNDSFDHHMACRSCKQFLIDVRFALLIEKKSITTFFTDPCLDFFTDDREQHDCMLVIEKRVGRFYRRMFQALDAKRLCQNYLHLCSSWEADYAVTDNEIQNDLQEY